MSLGMYASAHVEAGGVIASETWTGTDGAAWPGQWIDYLESNAACSATIQSNRGRLTAGGGAYKQAQIFIDVDDQSDIDVTMDVGWGDVGEQYHNFVFRCGDTSALGSGGPRSSYAIELAPRSAENYGSLVRRNASGVNTELQEVTGGVRTTERLNLRVQAIGSQIKAKWWLVGDPEPGTWQIERTDGTYTTGAIGFASFNGATSSDRTVDYDNLTINPA